MKRFITIISGLILTGLILAHSDGNSKTIIIGKIRPADGAEMVWVVGEKDSLKASISQGQFYFEVKPGTYKLIVDALPPYQDVLLENLLVHQDETLDVGEIILKQ
jgi:hypothetical protein